jgi:hypothetical protein
MNKGSIQKKHLIRRRIAPRGDILAGCAMVGCSNGGAQKVAKRIFM